MPIQLTTILIILIIFLTLMIWIFYKLGLRQGRYKSELEWQKNLPLFQRQTADRQRSTIKGQLAEKFAPFLPGFPFKPSECKFIGDPIDYLVFEGLDERDIKKIHLLEVKNNTSRLSKHQKQIKNILDNLNSDEVTFKEFKFNDEKE